MEEEWNFLKKLKTERLYDPTILLLGIYLKNIKTDDTTLMTESEELKSLLLKVKKESEKNWLKTQHSKN